MCSEYNLQLNSKFIEISRGQNLVLRKNFIICLKHCGRPVDGSTNSDTRGQGKRVENGQKIVDLL